METTAYVPAIERPASSCERHTWRKFFAAVFCGPDCRTDSQIARYLESHAHDLPPAVWIELERRRMGP